MPSLALGILSREGSGFLFPLCNKYRHVPDDSESIPLFIGKSALKNKTSAQQDQARCAIEFYFVLLSPEPPCQQRPVSDVPAVSETKGNFTVIKRQDAVSHYHQVSEGKTDYYLPEKRKKSACSHLHADSVRERVNAGWIGASKCEVIFERTLTLHQSDFCLIVVINLAYCDLYMICFFLRNSVMLSFRPKVETLCSVKMKFLAISF